MRHPSPALGLFVAFLLSVSACSSAHHQVAESATVTMRDDASQADIDSVLAYLERDPHVKSIRFKGSTGQTESVHLFPYKPGTVKASSSGLFEIALQGTVDAPRESAALHALPGVSVVEVKVPRHT